jgi:hydrogenase-4 component E
MPAVANLLLLCIALTCFAALGTSRISACIRVLAWQGAMLGVLPLFLEDPRSWHVVLLAVGTVTVKAYVLPRLLRWAMREAAVKREVEPLIGYMGSLLLGVLALGVSFAVARRLPTIEQTGLLIPVALLSLIIGLIVLITRNKAVTQVVGYLVFENGIFLFGLTQVERVPFLVEVGVLLDVFVGVFIMGIVVFHINREFDTISAAQLSNLHGR